MPTQKTQLLNKLKENPNLPLTYREIYERYGTYIDFNGKTPDATTQSLLGRLARDGIIKREKKDNGTFKYWFHESDSNHTQSEHVEDDNSDTEESEKIKLQLKVAESKIKFLEAEKNLFKKKLEDEQQNNEELKEKLEGEQRYNEELNNQLEKLENDFNALNEKLKAFDDIVNIVKTISNIC